MRIVTAPALPETLSVILDRGTRWRIASAKGTHEGFQVAEVTASPHGPDLSPKHAEAICEEIVSRWNAHASMRAALDELAVLAEPAFAALAAKGCRATKEQRALTKARAALELRP